MTKVGYFNDTGKLVRIHPATWQQCSSESTNPIGICEVRVFEYSDGFVPVIKQWGDGAVLVMLFPNDYKFPS